MSISLLSPFPELGNMLQICLPLILRDKKRASQNSWPKDSATGDSELALRGMSRSNAMTCNEMQFLENKPRHSCLSFDFFSIVAMFVLR
jgi:hypothetical protein